MTINPKDEELKELRKKIELLLDSHWIKDIKKYPGEAETVIDYALILVYQECQKAFEKGRKSMFKELNDTDRLRVDIHLGKKNDKTR